MRLFRRHDGALVKDVSDLRRMMPFLIRRRNEAVIYHTTQWEVGKARSWLRRYNRGRRHQPPAALFHLLVYGCSKALHQRPGLNRFVAGGRLYQRADVWISFAVKKRMTDDAPLATVKLMFPANESFHDCVTRIASAVEEGRSGQEGRLEREVRVLTRFPAPLVRAILGAARWLDQVNLLPAALIDSDPLYTTLFLVNLGSLGIARTYHHLYEYGTCGLFGVMGSIQNAVVAGRNGRPDIRQLLPVHWSFDERVNDGFYCVESLAIVQRLIEDPERYIGPANQRPPLPDSPGTRPVES